MMDESMRSLRGGGDGKVIQETSLAILGTEIPITELEALADLLRADKSPALQQEELDAEREIHRGKK